MQERHDITKALLKMVRAEVKPAVGCTEPVAVAFAAATARKYLAEEALSIELKTSLSIYKNGKSVLIPGAGKPGLALAAAIGAMIVAPADGLLIFDYVTDDVLKKAQALVNEQKVSVTPLRTSKDVYIDVLMKSNNHKVHVILCDDHTNIYKVEVDDQEVYAAKGTKKSPVSNTRLRNLTFAQMRQIIEKVPVDDILFLLDGVEMNRNAAMQGLGKTEGLNLGAGLLRLQNGGKLPDEPSLQARILTAAGADFRMGGGRSPVMTSGGSGNQGLGIILPISVVAKSIDASDEKLARALLYGHIVNLFVKAHTGKLSALCGCAIAAGIGAAAGIAWLLDGSDEQIAGAVNNMLANLTGMICDGAKESCAMKLSTSAGEAVLAAYLACSGVIVPDETGIIDGTVEGTIRNVGIFSEKGLIDTDMVLVNIMN